MILLPVPININQIRLATKFPNRNSTILDPLDAMAIIGQPPQASNSVPNKLQACQPILLQQADAAMPAYYGMSLLKSSPDMVLESITDNVISQRTSTGLYPPISFTRRTLWIRLKLCSNFAGLRNLID